jgi:2-amino-4-hydroxy-6-hydroxymethyldihydropteridine diphosphokinase
VTSHRAYLGIGSNLGDRLGHLERAVVGLAASAGVAVVAVSPVYETAPVGGPPQPDYLNAVVGLDTDTSPRRLLDLAQRLESAAGRVRGERWGPRTLDVDVLLVGDETVHEPDLEVPHPRLRERGFVLAPLHDLDPDLTGPPPSDGWPGVRRTDLVLTLP